MKSDIHSMCFYVETIVAKKRGSKYMCVNIFISISKVVSQKSACM